PGELEDAVRGLVGQAAGNVLVGLDDGDDAAAVLVRDDLAVLSTADFFTPVVDDAYDWGRIAAANALSDIYAMGGTPITAINLVGWPREVLPLELLTEVLRGGLDMAAEANCRSEEHTSELQSRENLVCRLLLEKKKPSVLHRTHR